MTALRRFVAHFEGPNGAEDHPIYAASIQSAYRYAKQVQDDPETPEEVGLILKGVEEAPEEQSTPDLLDPEGSGYVPEPPWDNVD